MIGTMASSSESISSSSANGVSPDKQSKPNTSSVTSKVSDQLRGKTGQPQGLRTDSTDAASEVSSTSASSPEKPTNKDSDPNSRQGSKEIENIGEVARSVIVEQASMPTCQLKLR